MCEPDFTDRQDLRRWLSQLALFWTPELGRPAKMLMEHLGKARSTKLVELWKSSKGAIRSYRAHIRVQFLDKKALLDAKPSAGIEGLVGIEGLFCWPWQEHPWSTDERDELESIAGEEAGFAPEESDLRRAAVAERYMREAVYGSPPPRPGADSSKSSS